MTLTAPDGTSFSGFYRGAAAGGFAVRRRALDACLLDAARAAGAAVREGVAVSGVLALDGRVTGVVADDAPGGTEIRARLVIGADGRRSVVARQLGLLREHPRLRKFAVRGYWSGMQGLGEMGEMHVAPHAYCGVAPLGAGDANVTFVVDRDAMRGAGGDLEGFYRATLGRWPRLVERLSGAALAEAPRAIGPLALVARRVSSAGAAVVGDAAGFYDPFTGEGVTLALRGAEILAGVADDLLRGRADRLDAYDRLRDAATRDKFRLNRLLQLTVERPWLANAVARRLARRPDLADRLVGIAGDFVPARSALGVQFAWELMRS
jgi:flavin-dependent dehydrogenase